MTLPIDHILWATPRFEAGVERVRDLTGVSPQYGGVHPGLGTQNALLRLGERCYLEVIGPDPQQARPGSYGEILSAYSQPGIFTLAMRVTDMAATTSALRSLGLATDGPVPMRRRREDGAELAWQVLMIKDAELGFFLPFFIDWGNAPHPAGSAPAGCALRSVQILHPRAERLGGLLAGLGIDLAVVQAPAPGFNVEIDTPSGPISLGGAA